MINKVILVGRITRDPELRHTSTGTSFVGFTLAVNRRFKSQSGEREADFINCMAWTVQADFIGKYVKKGALLGVEGTLQSRKVEENGQNRTQLDVRVENVNIIDNNNNTSSQPSAPTEDKSEADKVYEQARKNIGNDDLGF
jgi:single-strand DNA-binding protein